MIEDLPRELLLEIFPILQLRALNVYYKQLVKLDYEYLISCCRYTSEDIQVLVATGQHRIALIVHDDDGNYICSNQSDSICSDEESREEYSTDSESSYDKLEESDEWTKTIDVELLNIGKGLASLIFSAQQNLTSMNLDDSPSCTCCALPDYLREMQFTVDIAMNVKYLLSSGVPSVTANDLARRTAVKSSECLVPTMRMLWLAHNADCILDGDECQLSEDLYDSVNEEGEFEVTVDDDNNLIMKSTQITSRAYNICF